jgi:hypothetical protein
VKSDEQSTLFPAKIFKFHEQHAIVCTELEPWERHTIDYQGKINVAKSKSKLFKGKVGPIFIVHILAITFLELLAF